jgi:hypothetical protein
MVQGSDLFLLDWHFNEDSQIVHCGGMGEVRLANGVTRENGGCDVATAICCKLGLPHTYVLHRELYDNTCVGVAYASLRTQLSWRHHPDHFLKQRDFPSSPPRPIFAPSF